MAFPVVTGAMMSCSFGAAPSTLNVLPTTQTTISNMPAANIMSNAPIVNIPPFGVCTSMANPEVVAATAAALGVLTPMPCVPVTPAPWVPGSPTVLMANMPTLTNSCQLMCTWGGVITFSMAGQVQTTAP
jgi:hypothetical protein